MVHLSAFADEIDPDPETQIRILLENGIHHIEFRAIHSTNVLDLSLEKHQQFRSLLGVHAMSLSAIGSPIGKIAITDPFEPHLERFEKALELADFYDCPRIRIFSFYIPEGDQPSDHREAVMNRLQALVDRAQTKGIMLLLENEKGIYGDTPERVLDVLGSVASPALANIFDPANYLEVGASIGNAWDLLKSKTVHIHVKDYDIHTHKNVPAGQGQGEIPRLIADAVSRGFAGFCTLEPHLVVAEKSYGFTGPERFGEAARALKQELDRVGVAYA